MYVLYIRFARNDLPKIVAAYGAATKKVALAKVTEIREFDPEVNWRLHDGKGWCNGKGWNDDTPNAITNEWAHSFEGILRER